jgi:hypothetical protein
MYSKYAGKSYLPFFYFCLLIIYTRMKFYFDFVFLVIFCKVKCSYLLFSNGFINVQRDLLWIFSFCLFYFDFLFFFNVIEQVYLRTLACISPPHATRISARIKEYFIRTFNFNGSFSFEKEGLTHTIVFYTKVFASSKRRGANIKRDNVR